VHVRVVRFTDAAADRVAGLLSRIEQEGGPPPGIPVKGAAISASLADEELREPRCSELRWATGSFGAWT